MPTMESEHFRKKADPVTGPAYMEKMRQKTREYYQKNKEKVLLKSKAYLASHPELKKSSNRKWMQDGRGKIWHKEYAKTYFQKLSPEKRKQQLARRRERYRSNKNDCRNKALEYKKKNHTELMAKAEARVIFGTAKIPPPLLEIIKAKTRLIQKIRGSKYA